MWLVQVVLDNPSSDTIFLGSCLDVGENVVHFATKKDSFALGEAIWFHDVGLPFLLFVFLLL